MDLELEEKGKHPGYGGHNHAPPTAFVPEVNSDTDFSPSFKKQLRALFLKNASLQKRRKITNFCQLCIPLTVIILIGVTNIIILSAFGNNDATGEIIEIKYFYPQSLIESVYWNGVGYFYYTTNGKVDVGVLAKNGTKSGMLGTVEQRMWGYWGNNGWVPYDNETFLPFLDEYATTDELDAAIGKKKLELLEFHADHNYNYKYDFQGPQNNESIIPPIGGIIFTEVERSPGLKLAYTAMYDDQQTTFSWLSGENRVDATLALVNNAFVKWALNASWGIYSMLQDMPYAVRDVDFPFDVTGYMAMSLFPFAFSFLLPVYIHGVVHEKQEKLIEMMKMAGMKMHTYWIINFIYNFTLYVVVAGIVIAIGLIFQIRFFTTTSPLITITLFLGWGLNQVAFAMFASTLFSSARTATVLSYLLVILSVISGNLVNNIAYYEKPAPIAYLLWPNYAFYRATYLIGVACGELRCPTSREFYWGPGREIPLILVILYSEAVVFSILTPYMDAIMPKQYGVRKSPIFPFVWIYHKLRKTKDTNFLVKSESEHMQKTEDGDVAEERKLVEGLTERDVSTYPVIIKNLHKRYGDKVAVVDLCLALKTNETFGLLGPNGAGKTTTISMCTGLFGPTNGDASIGGFSIRTEMDDIHQILGTCPQFDILWETLTCGETLLFYSRLKGCPKDAELSQVKKYLSQVGLEESDETLVKDLSGGMKRRLSVAVSLVGNPKVILLDEPTTGLDPDTRRHLWNVLLQVKANKCLILTTHSMEEADVLCDRIGIMSRGTLRCIGTNVRLKNKFGTGYSLKINFDPADEQIVTGFCQRVAPTAELQESFPGNFTYRIPQSDLVMSQLLEEFSTHRDDFRIREWGISQTTLEDVFLNIVKEEEEAPTGPAPSR